jgi:hypothetical protein
MRDSVSTQQFDIPSWTRKLKRGEMGQTGNNQRRELRARMSQRCRIRIPDTDHPAEICSARDVSRSGLYFVTHSTHYLPGMKVCVIRNFDPDDQMSTEEIGDIVRVDSLRGDRKGVAIQLGAPTGLGKK